jgi:hypothetical protein
MKNTIVKPVGTGKANKKKTGDKDTGVSINSTGVTGKIRAHAGRGLSNEGTNVSYEDQDRNG